MTLFAKREKLLAGLRAQTDLHKKAESSAAPLQQIIDSLHSGELSIAVVGEINRGKSTFLNALLGTKLFPSHVTICTAGVTVLDHADQPRAEIWYRNKSKPVSVELAAQNPMASLLPIISRKNPKVKDIRLVRIWYPNQFTGNGILLVDTPGVNDPEMWREEITYQYLASADAVIMLLDPMQPLSASETEFLESKILGHSIANLLFVLNKIDNIDLKERQRALDRIEDKLSEIVPNPRIYPLSAKQALQAKLSKDSLTLQTSGIGQFEEALMRFLEQGRGGLLLRTKVQKALDLLAENQASIQLRVAALDSERDEVEAQLKAAEADLKKLKTERQDLVNTIRSREKSVRREIQREIQHRLDHLRNQLKPAILREPDVEVLRGNIFSFQRDSIEAVRLCLEMQRKELMDEFSVHGIQIEAEIHSLMDSLYSTAESTSNSLEISTAQAPAPGGGRVAGGVAGASVGTAAGVAVASSLTTTAVSTTATGALVATTTAALGTAGIIGVGLLTGGVGLLVGVAAATMLSKGSSNEGEHYIDSQTIVNNQRAVLAAEKFITNIGSTASPLAKTLIQQVQMAIVEPIERKEAEKYRLMENIKHDLTATDNKQAEKRKELAELSLENDELHKKYIEEFGELLDMNIV